MSQSYADGLPTSPLARDVDFDYVLGSGMSDAVRLESTAAAPSVGAFDAGALG